MPLRLVHRALRLPHVHVQVGAPVRVARCLGTSARVFHPHSTAPAASSTTATQPHLSPAASKYHPATSSVFTPLDTFLPRHLGPRSSDVEEMLGALGYKSLDDFVDAAIPSNVRVAELTDKDDGSGVRPLSELELRRRAEQIAAMNKPMKSYIGMG